MRRSASRIYPYDCPRCGSFSITHEFLCALPAQGLDDQTIANASGWIREHPGVSLYERDLEMLQNLATPSVGDRADKLLMFLERKYPGVGRIINIDSDNPEIVATCWARHGAEVRYLYRDYLGGRSLVGVVPSGQQITPNGWDHLQKLRRRDPDSQIGFCAMWFHRETETAWIEAIQPAIAQSGHQPVRIDKLAHNNRIDDEIISSIRRSKFVVADFTHGGDGARGGVYFETGFAMGLGLQVVHTCRADMISENKIHFDNRQYNFVVWKADELAAFKDALQNRIEATVGSGKYRRKHE